MSNDIRPGWKTTDWWITLATFVVTGLVLTGVVSQDSSGDTINVISHTVESVGMILAQWGIISKYLSNRHSLKMAAHTRTKTTVRKKGRIVTKTTDKDLSSSDEPSNKPRRKIKAFPGPGGR